MQSESTRTPEGGDALSPSLIAGPAGPWPALMAAVMGLFRRKTRHRALAGLSNRQLRDAGIDLSLVRRGPAIAVEPDPNLEGLR